MRRHLIQPPTTMSGCNESKAQASQFHGSYMEVCAFGKHHMLGTNWAWREICTALVDCDHRKCSLKMKDLLVATMTLMMNAWHFLRMKVHKIGGRLTQAMNAAINIVWWLNIWQYSIWCCNSSVVLPIGAACHIQSRVSLLTFPMHS